MDVKHSALLVLLDKKIEFLNTYAEVSMLWWVSSVVFCAAIIGAVWRFRDDLTKVESRFALHFFALTVAVFFASIVIYGIFTVSFSRTLRAEVVSILDELGVAPYRIFEYKAFGILGGIGTTSFVLVLVIWLGLWRWLARKHAMKS